MTCSRPLTFLVGAALIPLAALAVAGCGGGGKATASQAPAKTASGRAPTVGVANTGLGKVLVDSKGRTLYLFSKDQGTKSTCFGECATDWPSLRVGGRPTVGSGAQPPRAPPRTAGE
jgi:predicted lipoprotein with Yx(FWY)xxD motif